MATAATSEKKTAIHKESTKKATAKRKGNGENTVSAVTWRVKYDKPFSEFIDITPVMAEFALGTMVPNRKAKRYHMQMLANAMKRDRWLPNNAGIGFNVNGQLFDGQNRLMAIISSGKTVRMLVVYGLDEEALYTVDINCIRSAADMATLKGIRYANLASAAARWCLIIKDPAYARAAVRFEVMEYLDIHPTLQQSCGLSFRALGPSQSLIAAMHHIVSDLLERPDDAAAMLQVFVTGDPTGPNCPFKAYREWVLRQRQGHILVTREAQLYGLIWAWNAYAKGEQVTKPAFPAYASIDDLDLNLL